MEERGESQEMRDDKDTKSVSQITGEAEASVDYTPEERSSLSSRLRGVRGRFYDTFVNWDYGLESCEVIGVVDYSKYRATVKFSSSDSTFTRDFFTDSDKSVNDLLLTTNSSNLNELIGKELKFERTEGGPGMDKKILLRESDNTVFEDIKYYYNVLGGKVGFVGHPEENNNLASNRDLNVTPLGWFVSTGYSILIALACKYALSSANLAGPIDSSLLTYDLILLVTISFFSFWGLISFIVCLSFIINILVGGMKY